MSPRAQEAITYMHLDKAIFFLSTTWYIFIILHFTLLVIYLFILQVIKRTSSLFLFLAKFM